MRTPLKVARFVLAPLAVASAIGLAAGMAATLGARLLNLRLTDWQESVALYGFVVLFAAFGLVDSANRFVRWKRGLKSGSTRRE